jgi:hypothetical protein
MLHVTDVKWLGEYVLQLSFDNGESKVVDVESLLEGPVFEPLRNPSTFGAVEIDPVSRTVVWPNGVDLAPEALYELTPVDAANRP